MLELLVLIFASLLNVVLGLLVYTKNPNSATNRLFVALAGSFVIWSTTNYLSVHPFGFEQLTLARLVLFFACYLCLFVYLTFTTYPDIKFDFHTKHRLIVGYTVLVSLLTLTPLVFKGLVFKDGVVSPLPNPGIILFATLVLILLVGGLLTMVKKYRRAVGVQRQQLRLILLGLAVTFGLIVLTNLILVVAFNNGSLLPLAPAYTLIFTGSFAYAIIKHKLFDIRAAVARSVGYLMVVFSITLVYGVGLFGIIDVLFQGSDKETLRQVLSVILITPLALQFQRTKEFFDRITNRLFYRDAYDSQDVLDKMGDVAVSELELYRILRSTRMILSEALKTSFVEFILIKNGKHYFEARTSNNIKAEHLALRSMIHEQRKALLVVDEMRPTGKLHQEMIDAGVAISMRLKTQEQVVGYILFGDKRSGDIYTSQDKKLLEILASQLSVSIQNALRFEEIQNFNLTLQTKVDGATRNLRHLNEKLKALDETKDDFISMASHQLRTPLTSVKGYISLVLEGDAGKLTPLQKQMLDQAYTSSQRMVYLIADLLNVSRLKTGKFIIESKPVNLARIVNEEMAQLKETAKSRQLTLDYVQPEDFPEVMLDETKIRQVIMNFADNAIYYTPAGGKIKVELVNNPLTIELRIIDNGLGVPKAEQPHLFTKFYRAGNARKARPDGTGLGLFMAKKVIAAQGGALIFESTEGKGSTFGFVFSKHNLAVPETPVK